MVDIRNVFSDNRVLSAADLSALLAFTACASRLVDRGVTFPHRRSDLIALLRVPILTVKGDVSRLRKQLRVFPGSVSGGVRTRWTVAAAGRLPRASSVSVAKPNRLRTS